MATLTLLFWGFLRLSITNERKNTPAVTWSCFLIINATYLSIVDIFQAIEEPNRSFLSRRRWHCFPHRSLQCFHESYYHVALSIFHWWQFPHDWRLPPVKSPFHQQNSLKATTIISRRFHCCITALVNISISLLPLIRIINVMHSEGKATNDIPIARFSTRSIVSPRVWSILASRKMIVSLFGYRIHRRTVQWPTLPRKWDWSR